MGWFSCLSSPRWFVPSCLFVENMCSRKTLKKNGASHYMRFKMPPYLTRYSIILEYENGSMLRSSVWSLKKLHLKKIVCIMAGNREGKNPFTKSGHSHKPADNFSAAHKWLEGVDSVTRAFLLVWKIGDSTLRLSLDNTPVFTWTYNL